jgi:hypothetical protein
MNGWMQTFEIHSGRRTVTVQSASTAQEALIEYLRSSGCRDDEIVRLGPESISWRGAVYNAISTDAGRKAA